MNFFQNAQAFDSKVVDITAFQSAGGCSCKLPADALKVISESEAVSAAKPAGHETDDAAFVELDGDTLLVSSIDFQNPVLPDAYKSGQIAALNALSDIFACGAKPAWAEAVLALPRVDEAEQIAMGQQLMAGMASVCKEIGCNIVGGHTIVLEAPLIGLAVRSVAPKSTIKRKSGAKRGDTLLLTKPIGNGIAVAARQTGFLQDAAWDVAERAMLSPNSVGALLGSVTGVTALTDVTGFGLLGHAVEMAEASNACVEININAIPLLQGIKRAASAGHVPMLASSNLESFSSNVAFADSITDPEKHILADPQTNGGLLIAADPTSEDEIIEICASQSISAEKIGKIVERDGPACRFVKE